MPDQYLGANDRNAEGVTLNRMPKGPPDRVKGRDDERDRGETPPKTPAEMALKGLAQIKNGQESVTAALPGLPLMLIQMGSTYLTLMQAAVAQGLAGGRQGPAGPSQILTPPGMAAGAGGGPPQGIGAGGGAPGAPTPLPPGIGQ